jgi:hypothetical protein
MAEKEQRNLHNKVDQKDVFAEMRSRNARVTKNWAKKTNGDTLSNACAAFFDNPLINNKN